MAMLEVEKEMFQTRDGIVDLKRQILTKLNDWLSKKVWIRRHRGNKIRSTRDDSKHKLYT